MDVKVVSCVFLVMQTLATVTELPDTQVVGCYYPQAERSFVRQFGGRGNFHPFSPLISSQTSLNCSLSCHQ